MIEGFWHYFGCSIIEKRGSKTTATTTEPVNTRNQSVFDTIQKENENESISIMSIQGKEDTIRRRDDKSHQLTEHELKEDVYQKINVAPSNQDGSEDIPSKKETDRNILFDSESLGQQLSESKNQYKSQSQSQSQDKSQSQGQEENQDENEGERISPGRKSKFDNVESSTGIRQEQEQEQGQGQGQRHENAEAEDTIYSSAGYPIIPIIIPTSIESSSLPIKSNATSATGIPTTSTHITTRPTTATVTELVATSTRATDEKPTTATVTELVATSTRATDEKCRLEKEGGEEEQEQLQQHLFHVEEKIKQKRIWLFFTIAMIHFLAKDVVRCARYLVITFHIATLLYDSKA
eukprot:Awhi_evm1s3610